MVSALYNTAPNNKDVLITELSSISYALYDWLRRLYPKSLVSGLTVVLLSPLLLVLAVVVLILLGVGHAAMIYLNFRLKRMIQFEIEITVVNYTESRTTLRVLDTMLHYLDKIVNHPDYDLFLVRPFVNQAKTTHAHLLGFRTKLEDAMRNLDAVNFPSTIFNHLTQDELWANRSKAYNYLT